MGVSHQGAGMKRHPPWKRRHPKQHRRQLTPADRSGCRSRQLSEGGVMRERRSMTALPLYYLHVWWARQPLVASRAAILASLLPSTQIATSSCTCSAFMAIRGEPNSAWLRPRASRSGDG
ncbi:MAG: DUF1156 domain-containing protein [Phycisphaerales bacterium]